MSLLQFSFWIILFQVNKNKKESFHGWGTTCSLKGGTKEHGNTTEDDKPDGTRKNETIEDCEPDGSTKDGIKEEGNIEYTKDEPNEDNKPDSIAKEDVSTKDQRRVHNKPVGNTQDGANKDVGITQAV